MIEPAVSWSCGRIKVSAGPEKATRLNHAPGVTTTRPRDAEQGQRKAAREGTGRRDESRCGNGSAPVLAAPGHARHCDQSKPAQNSAGLRDARDGVEGQVVQGEATGGVLVEINDRPRRGDGANP